MPNYKGAYVHKYHRGARIITWWHSTSPNLDEFILAFRLRWKSKKLLAVILTDGDGKETEVFNHKGELNVPF